MSLWVDIPQAIIQDVLRSSGPGSEIRIQVRDTSGLWREHSAVSDNPESVQGGLRATESATRQPVRATDVSGRMVDFR